jgi:hypothetical protein
MTALDVLLLSLRAFIQEPIGLIEVGALHPKISEALGSSAKTAMLSAETMAKQAINHRDLVPDDCLLIPQALLNPTVISFQAEPGSSCSAPAVGSRGWQPRRRKIGASSSSPASTSQIRARLSASCATTRFCSERYRI